MKASTSKSIRTTLSINAELGSRLKDVAESKRISILEATRAAVEEYVETKGAMAIGKNKSAIKPALEIVETVKKMGSNPYLDMIANWRLSRTLGHIQEIGSGSLRIEAWPAEIYLMRILTEILRNLGPQDEFLVVTNLRFWNDYAAPGGILGPNTVGYLSAQFAALKRGMRLFRVFLLSKSQIREERSQLESHLNFLREAKRENAQIDVAYIEVEDEQIADAIADIGLFACIRRRNSKDPLSPRDPDQGRLIVEPDYLGTTRIRNLNLVFSQGEAQEDMNSWHYMDRFFQVAVGSHSLEEL